MRLFILATLFALIAGIFTTAALAQPTVKVQVGTGAPTDPDCATGEDPGTTLVINSPSDTVTQFFGTCGDITLDSPSLACIDVDGDCPALTAQTNGLTDQLILNNTVITNNSDSSFHTITITYKHTFSGIDPNQDRYYGMSASGNFFRLPFDLASGDSFKMTSSVTYQKSSGTLVTEQIGGSIGSGAVLQYGPLLDFGSVSLNDFTPQDPAQVIEKINCSSLKPTGQKCSTTFGEQIQTALTVVLGPFDSISLLGSAHNPVTNDTTSLANILSSLTAVADVKPGESEPLVGPDDQGSLEVTLYGGKDTTTLSVTSTSKKGGPKSTDVKILPFDVTKVNLPSVRFGPNCPAGYPDQPGCKANVIKNQSQFKDDNGDGVVDVRLFFNNPDIGWSPNCDPLQKSGTLVGFLEDNTTFFSATAPISCQPPK